MTTRTRWSRLGDIVVGGAAAAVMLLTAPVARRWYNRWGASDAELARPLPGDELVKEPKLGYTRAITINAPPEDVWPWLAQFGQGRGGFYSYDGLENLIGCDIHSTADILVDHQQLGTGDIIRSGPDTYPCWVVMDIEAPHRLILQGAGTPAEVEIPDIVDDIPDRGYAASTWQWVLEPIDNDARARLIVRQRCTYSPRQTVLWHIIEPLNFVMERQMLHGIKTRAECHHLRRTERVNGTDHSTSDPQNTGRTQP